MSTAATPKKKVAATKPKKPSSHPKYTEMIATSIESLKERGGSSRQAILKYISSHYDVGKNEWVVNQHLKMALRVGVKSGSLKQAKGTGASGSFRLGEKVKPATAATKKPSAAKKSSKKVVKKVTKSPKKVAAKSPKKVVKKNVKPKAASKPKAAAKPKKTPVKAKKSSASKPKKAAPAKKAAKKA